MWDWPSVTCLSPSFRFNASRLIKHQALAPYVTQCVGIDLSEGMVNEYNTSAQNQGIAASEMHAVLGNLLDVTSPNPPSLSGPEFHDFDIAAVGLGFHHFDDPALAAKRLAERLKKGGVLMIVDFMPHEHFHGHDGQGHGHDHSAKKTVMHMGFSEEEVKRVFEGAGVGGVFEFVVLGKGVVFEDREKGAKMERSVFMARGSKL
jgi:SAM-dependent methyltransferase